MSKKKNIVKITWKAIYDDFKRRHPNMSKRVVDWRPHNYATIKLYLDDGVLATYNYDEHCMYYISQRWIKD